MFIMDTFLNKLFLALYSVFCPGKRSCMEIIRFEYWFYICINGRLFGCNSVYISHFKVILTQIDHICFTPLKRSGTFCNDTVGKFYLIPISISRSLPRIITYLISADLYTLHSHAKILTLWLVLILPAYVLHFVTESFSLWVSMSVLSLQYWNWIQYPISLESFKS